jgi:hypothetical protein
MSDTEPLDTTQSVAFAEVLGFVKSSQLEAMAIQIQYFNQWAAFLSNIDWSTMGTEDGGPTGNAPPPPPKWPPA